MSLTDDYQNIQTKDRCPSTVVAANVSENSQIGSSCISWSEGQGNALGRLSGEYEVKLLIIIMVCRRGAGDTRFTLGLFGLRCRFGPEFKE